MDTLAQFCIIGPTASGKTSLALTYARRHRAVILSLDSLAVYRGIDIASAKPTSDERGEVPHFGIDLIPPDAPFNVTHLFRSYREAAAFAREHHRPLVLVGGSGFYLKMLIEGISPMPQLSDATRAEISTRLLHPQDAYRYLEQIDPQFAGNIQPTDTYRIEKGLTIHRATGMRPSDYFAAHPPEPVLPTPFVIYEVVTERSVLRKRIASRTDTMLRTGLIDEVCRLERQYTRAPRCMKAIGITEVLSYLDGRYDYGTLREKIIIHTARLARRQITFNKSQFGETVQGTLERLEEILLADAQNEPDNKTVSL